jgi:DNA-binding transcriptional LysR family regulator
VEEELGGLLFSRERNNTHLTDLGRLIEPHLAEVVAQAGQAKQTAARFTLSVGFARSGTAVAAARSR